MKKIRQKTRWEDLVGIGVPASKLPPYDPMMTAYIWADEEELEPVAKEPRIG